MFLKNEMRISSLAPMVCPDNFEYFEAAQSNICVINLETWRYQISGNLLLKKLDSGFECGVKRTKAFLNLSFSKIDSADQLFPLVYNPRVQNVVGQTKYDK